MTTRQRKKSNRKAATMKFQVRTTSPRPAPRVATLSERITLTAQGFLLHNPTGETYTLSDTGICVVRELLAGRDRDEVWSEVARTFDVAEEEARRDVADFLTTLVELDLLPAASPKSPSKSQSKANRARRPARPAAQATARPAT